MEGVNVRYIHIIPMGKEQPFATNSTPEGRELNRRVEFFISDIPEAAEKAVQLIPFNPCFRNFSGAEISVFGVTGGDRGQDLESKRKYSRVSS
jgi:hypothetical protein